MPPSVYLTSRAHNEPVCQLSVVLIVKPLAVGCKGLSRTIAAMYEANLSPRSLVHCSRKSFLRVSKGQSALVATFERSIVALRYTYSVPWACAS